LTWDEATALKPPRGQAINPHYNTAERSTFWLETVMNLLLSVVAMAFGAFVVVWPARAAKILAAGRLDSLEPPQKTLFLRWYRLFGIILLPGGLLSSVYDIAI
jgi:hypothetical protein